MMRCHICNTILEPTQIRKDKHDEWMPCPKCVTESWVTDDMDDEDMEFLSIDLDAMGWSPPPE